MRAPCRKRPLRRTLDKNVNQYELDVLSEKVTYIGSPEHKDTPSFAGTPRPRADASICDRELSQDRERVQQWLECAVSSGCVGELKEGEFPRYVWYRDTEIVYEGRLVNRGNGEYKGYPLHENEWPEGWKQK